MAFILRSVARGGILALSHTDLRGTRLLTRRHARLGSVYRRAALCVGL
jgi:hypothetical protein